MSNKVCFDPISLESLSDIVETASDLEVSHHGGVTIGQGVAKEGYDFTYISSSDGTVLLARH